MKTMTARQATHYERFSSRCHASRRQPEELERWCTGRHNAIKAAWMVSLGILCSYFLVLAGIIQ